MTMRIGVSWLCVAGLAALAVVGPAAAADLTGPLRVIDGDTVELQGQTVRLHGIDAPELGQNCRIKARLYDCGNVSRTALLDLTAGARVTCDLLAEATPPADGDGRPGRCFADGYDLSEGMAHTGWALADRAVSARYVRNEARAKDANRGLWKGRFVTPWNWRRGERLPAEHGTE